MIKIKKIAHLLLFLLNLLSLKNAILASPFATINACNTSRSTRHFVHEITFEFPYPGDFRCKI